MSHFQNRVALITGGASGIGKALGARLRGAGATVILADYDEGAVRRTAEELDCAHRWLDVRDLEAVESAVDEIEAAHGPIDFLFNNAGVAIAGECHKLDYEDWKKIIDVNVYGVIHGVHAVYPRMVERGSGHIINTASIAGLYPSAGQVPYSTSKYAVVGLSHSLRAEASSLGVKVTVICPGIIETPMRTALPIKGQNPDKLLELLPKGMPVEKCVSEIVRGVEKNQATVVITPMAHLLWTLERLSPELTVWLSGQVFGYARRAGSDEA